MTTFGKAGAELLEDPFIISSNLEYGINIYQQMCIQQLVLDMGQYRSKTCVAQIETVNQRNLNNCKIFYFKLTAPKQLTDI